MNKLYYGDNLHVLRDRKNFPDECVDLIYLDPPFNSKRDYNLLFKSPKVAAGGEGSFSAAQIEAFKDTWHWTTDKAEMEFDQVIKGPNTNVSNMMIALVEFLGRNDMTAYLVMMANRLLELHRVLKPTGSLYLHCDPVASHYLKLVLDAVFGKEQFRNEITWKRRVGMSSAVHESNKFGIITDSIFFYGKTDAALFLPQYNKDSPDYQEYIDSRFTLKDADGRRFQATSLVNPAYRPNLIYEYKGYKPPKNGWMIAKAKCLSEK